VLTLDLETVERSRSRREVSQFTILAAPWGPRGGEEREKEPREQGNSQRQLHLVLGKDCGLKEVALGLGRTFSGLGGKLAEREED